MKPQKKAASSGRKATTKTTPVAAAASKKRRASFDKQQHPGQTEAAKGKDKRPKKLPDAPAAEPTRKKKQQLFGRPKSLQDKKPLHHLDKMVEKDDAAETNDAAADKSKKKQDNDKTAATGKKDEWSKLCYNGAAAALCEDSKPEYEAKLLHMLPMKKRLKEEHKKREAKLAKYDFKDNSSNNPKIPTAKDSYKKQLDPKKNNSSPDTRKPSPIRPAAKKQEPKSKPSPPATTTPPTTTNKKKKTVLATKKSPGQFTATVKKQQQQQLADKKPKLVKEESLSSSEALPPTAVKPCQNKKKSILQRSKNMLIKKFAEENSPPKTPTKAQKTPPQKPSPKKEAAAKNGGIEKTNGSPIKKKTLLAAAAELVKDLDKNLIFEFKKSPPKEDFEFVPAELIKKEIIDDDIVDKIIKEKVVQKSKTPRKPKKPKVSKDTKDANTTTDTEKSDTGTMDESIKSPQSRTSERSVPSNDFSKVKCKVENTTTTESDDDDSGDEDYARRGRVRNFSKKKERTPSEERIMTNRMKLFGFWSGPKRHRVASLNALAKVHCLYENENGGVYLGGYCKPKPEKDGAKLPAKCKEEKEDKEEKEPKKEKKTGKKNDETSKRKLRNVPGLRGKHYDILDGLDGMTSSSDEDLEMKKERQKERRKKEKEKERIEKVKEKKAAEEREKERTRVENEKLKLVQETKKERENEDEEEPEEEETKAVVPVKKPKQKRKKKNTEVMDLKDMVVCKRMASLNASAILAASYSDEKNNRVYETSSESSSNSESEVEFIKKLRQSDSEIEKRKLRQAAAAGSDHEELVKPSKKVVIVNQDTDVTITGVYVNQTRSTHHEGFCSIAGMQYRISSTSHTQTAATAVATELHDQKEQPCKSYTPLGALSSMQPPGAQGNHSNMSPRRHSAFSAPHQHGYYQPAGPLIQHPPPPPLQVKGPPPDSTPTPPQNSEGSDDLVATSTTSGGTTSTGGGFYRTYCPQYYPTPPQYQDLCYPPSYSHNHPHPPPYAYHKYAPPYRRPYYYQEPGGNGGPGGSGPPVEYQPPPGEYMPYYPGYPPPVPPPPPNPAYLHSQGRPFAEHAFQGCPCPMQSCPKNADTGPLIGNGKGAPVATGPGLSLPPSALVGPPSPARGLAGLAPPHGANAWDTDRVQLNPAHRSHTHSHHLHHNHQQQQQQQSNKKSSTSSPSSSSPASSSHVKQQLHQQSASTSTTARTDCKGEKDCVAEGKLRNAGKCVCNKSTTTTTTTSATGPCGSEVKLEQSVSPDSATSSSPEDKHLHHHHHRLKLENNNVKCESCSSAERRDDSDDEDDEQPANHVGTCRVKCEAGYKCEIMKCEQCVKEAGQLMEMDKDSGILEDDAGSGKLETDTEVKEELNGITDATEKWKKPDYEPTAPEPVIEETDKECSEITEEQQQQQKSQKVGKRKLSLDSLSDFAKLKKINKRTMSVGSTRDFGSASQQQQPPASEPVEAAAMVNGHHEPVKNGTNNPGYENVAGKDSTNSSKKKSAKTENQSQKRNFDSENPSQPALKKFKKNPKVNASESSIMETIDLVVKQSIQMAEKASKTKKSKNSKGKVEKKNKKNSVLLTTIKTASKYLDIVNAAVSQKSELIKNELNKSHQKINNKVVAKIKSKVKNVKNSKVKAKMLKVKSKVLESKNISNKLVDVKKNKVLELKNTKVLDTKNVKVPDPKNNKNVDSKQNKVTEPKSSNKTVEPKNTNKTVESKNPNKPVESKSSNKIVEAKNSSTKTTDSKNTNRVPSAKSSKSKVQETKEVKDTKDLKESKVTPVALPAAPTNPKNKEPKVTKLKDCPKKAKAQQSVPLDLKKYKKKGGKATKKSVNRRDSFCKIEERNKKPIGKCLETILKTPFLKPKWSNGWSWEGQPFEAKVYLTNEESAIRRCYASMRHENGDVLRPRDCVLLRSGPRKADLPFVAKIAALWENPDDGEMMFSLLWYYRPEHTEQGRTEYDTDDEVFASRHRDANSVACIEDKCYILTFNEYCRYRKSIRRIEEGLDGPNLPRVAIVPPGYQQYPRKARQPRIPIAPDMVLFCRRVYDYRGKKLVKNPG